MPRAGGVGINTTKPVEFAFGNWHNQGKGGRKNKCTQLPRPLGELSLLLSHYTMVCIPINVYITDYRIRTYVDCLII